MQLLTNKRGWSRPIRVAANEDLADQVWEAWGSGAISDRGLPHSDVSPIGVN